MWPSAAVNGFYYGQPNNKYFVLGKISKDHIENYVAKESSEIERCRQMALLPDLNY